MRLAHLALILIPVSLGMLSCAPVTRVHKPPQVTTPAQAPLISATRVTPARSSATSSHTATTTPAEIKPPAAPSPIPATPESHISQQEINPSYQQLRVNGITLSLVSFDDRYHSLEVADQVNGPGSQWSYAKAAANSRNALAAINAGFFTPEGKPLGLVIENGSHRGSLNSSSLGAGMIYFSSQGASILRKSKYALIKGSTAGTANNLIQTGPMLAENNRTIAGLSKNNTRHRSFIAWDNKHHWIIGYTSPCSLDELSSAIAGKKLAGVQTHTAINLDGGRSSDLWVSGQIHPGTKNHRTFINKVVRNYLLLVKK